ncbi:MAG: ATP-binding protein, partial [Catenulispora sp.]
ADFGLTPLDVEILLIAVAPDLDSRFEALYGYLNDDVTRRRPTIGLALSLCGVPPADAAARARLSASAPLLAGDLLLVEETDRPFLGRALRVPDRVTAHLLGDDTPDPRLADLLNPSGITSPDRRSAPGAVPGPLQAAGPLARALAAGCRLAYLREEQGGAGVALAVAALAACGRPAVELDLDRLARDPAPADAVRAAAREARLTAAGMVVSPVDALARDHIDVLRQLAAAAPPAAPGSAAAPPAAPGVQGPTPAAPGAGGATPPAPGAGRASTPAVVLVGRCPWDADWSAHPPLLLAAPRVEPTARAGMWACAYGAPVPPAVDIDRVLAPFLLNPAQVARAAHSAAQQAALDGGPVTAEHVRRGARAQNAAGLDRLARRIEPAVGWADLVLPPDALAQLRELATRARHRDRVLGEWAMRPGGGRGRGVAALFAGDSGTGKTMSAEVIAADLGLDLYTVDLATVVDKYVGETEKNLERIFTEAAGVNGVLLFDEADAIFGKRSEVRDAHDRYANVESAYLLQRMESFDGLAILATNLRANLDDAFTRRLDLVVDFPMPEADHRRALWERCLGPTLPRAADLDLDFCAGAFELAGGNIRSVAVTAAYYAAESGGPVTMPGLIRAVQREYQKLGRLTLDTEFGHYLDYLT